MEIIFLEDKIILKDLNDFEPKHTFECGQCFRWNIEDDGSYTGVAFGKILNVKKDGDQVIFSNTNEIDFYNIWIPYLDLERDYGEIKTQLSKEDATMKDATDFGSGMRILSQEPWETLISFIISANNGIPRIKKSVELLSKNHGEYIGIYNDKEYYSFPSSKAVSNLTDEQLTSCGVGYRSKYILSTAKAIVEDNISLEELKALSEQECFEELLKFKGVGPKVANCILFFAMCKTESFPVDVWVKRVMEYFYFDKEMPNKKIEDFGREKFGKYAGFAQQYLFYYAREQGIGK